MDSENELELDGNDSTRGKNLQGVRRNIPIKLKNASNTSSKPRGRPRKTRSNSARSAKPKKEASPVEKNEVAPTNEDVMEDMEFSTMKTTGNEPTHKMQKLKWNHKVNLLGMKVIDPILHTCETCMLPILLYGRMLPCKHVFCYDCAKKTEKICTRCGDPVNRVEQSALGAVFLCNYGGTKHGVTGCRRTYLSQRDLQAHVNYRHLKQQADQSKPPPASVQPTSVIQQPPAAVVNMLPGPTVQTSSSYGLVHTTALMSPNMGMIQPQQQAHIQMSVQPGNLPVHDPNMLYQHALRTDTVSQPVIHPQVSPQIHQSLTPPMNQAPPPLQQQQQQQHMAPQAQQHMGPPPITNPVNNPINNPMNNPINNPINNPVNNPVNNPDNYSIPVMTNRTSNLITVPILDESNYGGHDAQQQYPPASAPTLQYMHPPPSQPMMTNPPQSHYNTVTQRPQLPPMSSYNTSSHPPPAQGMPNVSRPPLQQPIMNTRPMMNAPMNMPPVNLSQPPPMGGQAQPRPVNAGPPLAGPPHTGPPHTGPPPMMGNRYPSPAPQNMYNQPPPGNNRTWQGGPPPQSGHMGGPPPQVPPAQRPPTSSGNMGPPPQRSFYQ